MKNHPTQEVETKNTGPGTLVDACQRCANHWVTIWLKQGANFNDFGDRYCPFCGLNTDEATGIIMP